MLCSSVSKLIVVLALASALPCMQLTAMLQVKKEMKQVIGNMQAPPKDAPALKKNERILSLTHGTADSLNKKMGLQASVPSARNLTPARPRFLAQTKPTKAQVDKKAMKKDTGVDKKKKAVARKLAKKSEKSVAKKPRFLKQKADKDSIVVQYEPAKKKAEVAKKDADFFVKNRNARKLSSHGKKSKKAHKSNKHRKAKKAHKAHKAKKAKKSHKKAHKARNLQENKNKKKERNLMQLPSVNEFLGKQMKKYRGGGY